MEFNAIVNSGSRKLVCFVNNSLKPGDIDIAENAFEFRTDLIVIPTPNGPGKMLDASVVPLDAEDKAVDIHCKIDNIRWFKDMEDKGQKYINMIEQLKQSLIATRAQKANISVAKTMPKQNQSSKIIL